MYLKGIILIKYYVDFKLDIYFINKMLFFNKVCNLYCKFDFCCILIDVFVFIGFFCDG